MLILGSLPVQRRESPLGQDHAKTLLDNWPEQKAPTNSRLPV
jgi:hypothetical protein